MDAIKNECPYCMDSPELIEDDFCPKCGRPSSEYEKMVEEELLEDATRIFEHTSID